MTVERVRTSTFLRRVLLVDAATCFATGVLLALGAAQLEGVLGLPAQLSRYAGLSLLPFAVFLIYVARRESLSPPMVWAVIVANALWTIDSILLLLSGWIEPTTLGLLFVLVQAFGVAVFVALEYFGLRQSAAVAV